MRSLCSLHFVDMRGIVEDFPGVLVGESGVGKSTLAKILADVHHLEEGTISLNGQTVVIHHDKHLLRRI